MFSKLFFQPKIPDFLYPMMYGSVTLFYFINIFKTFNEKENKIHYLPSLFSFSPQPCGQVHNASTFWKRASFVMYVAGA